jgi:hypothetical protein
MFNKLQHKIEGVCTILCGLFLITILWGDPDVIRDIVRFLQKLPKAGTIFLTVLAAGFIWVGVKE